ncbi:MAG: metallopeptidase family protein [Actinomycetota bacterium]
MTLDRSIPVDEEEFISYVAEAIDSLPDDLAAEMDNVEIVVEDEPPAEFLVNMPRGHSLLGHYHGVPLTGRGFYDRALPDKISIYRGPITRLARTPEAIRDQIKRTVLHEIGHHFGIDEDRLHELGWG